MTFWLKSVIISIMQCLDSPPPLKYYKIVWYWMLRKKRANDVFIDFFFLRKVV